MPLTHLSFASADPFFYDTPSRGPAARRSNTFVPDAQSDWTGWRHDADDDLSGWRPRDSRLPEQGWKIHVSATPSGAADILRLVSGYCNAAGLPFTHAPTAVALLSRNSKDADRTASGRFITVYPADETQLRDALLALDALVGGRPGPYLLSDLRYKAGPLHVGYGAFAPLTVRGDGEDLPAIRTPEGDLVEDRRTAGFTRPPWVELPAFLREQPAALGGADALDGLAFAITRVLHRSNAGGVYEATDAAGERVILKEARPHAGLTPDGRDAVARLLDEESRLRALADDTVVGVRASVDLHGHRFLALDFVDGDDLHSAVVARTPATRANAAAADYLEYRQWALEVAAQTQAALERVHRLGYVHGDLHPGNVRVTAGGRVTLLDFEMCQPVADAGPVLIGAPGFVAPADADPSTQRGIGADRYALAGLKLFLFVPLTPLLALDPLKVDELLDSARDNFALDDDWVDEIRIDLGLPGRDTLATRSKLVCDADAAVRAWRTDSEDAILALQVMIGRSLDASADFARGDRAWPGDPRQFGGNGYGLAHGAAGVIHALESTSLELDPQALDWLGAATDAPQSRPGLYDGLAGAAWLQRRIGEDHLADDLLERVLRVDLESLGADLYGGLPGIGLYLLGEVDRFEEVEWQLARIAELLREHYDRRPDPDRNDPRPSARTGRGGLMWGATGTALFALRLYQRTGDAAHLRLAQDALDHDLARCTLAADGSLQLDEGGRLIPYLATGSAGIGMVAAELLPLVDNPRRYLEAIDAITLAACAPFAVEPGLFYGRAGLIHYLVAVSRVGLSSPETDTALAAHVAALQLHAVRHSTGIGFPGRGLLRLSCDLATGAAGILAALQAYRLSVYDPSRDGWQDLLPLLGPPTDRFADAEPTWYRGSSGQTRW
ncbi:class III lanthionine synthetase LanKC [Conyzicola nivalis]|uniref:non-specific serine/threonine protein kinase n=1 Tax=Conyzicola nivalis TaxID=1477021 RepID=A0A916WF27_9MICO|nr:class III lanthionine synthetase LanKC [Conyzicola nivalis]GGA94502.1 serine/threonine protein kinase [Conyzicola nivalis]